MYQFQPIYGRTLRFYTYNIFDPNMKIILPEDKYSMELEYNDIKELTIDILNYVLQNLKFNNIRIYPLFDEESCICEDNYNMIILTYTRTILEVIDKNCGTDLNDTRLMDIERIHLAYSHEAVFGGIYPDPNNIIGAYIQFTDGSDLDLEFNQKLSLFDIDLLRTLITIIEMEQIIYLEED